MRHTHYYRVKARTHFELGYKLAKLFKSPSLDTYRVILKQTFFNKKILSESQIYFHLTQEYFPNYIEELKGYANGLGVDFGSFWLTFLFEELNAYPEKCTSCFSSDGMIIGHNEDFDDYFKKRISLVEKTVGDISIFELYYYNSLGGTSCSVNSHGYVQTINTQNHTDQRIGIPRNVIARWLSETVSPEKDYEKMKKIMRSMGYSHTFGNMNGVVRNIESSANASQYVDVKLPFVHTNHYLTDLSIYEDKQRPGNSIERFDQATKLIATVKTAQDMMTLLEAVSSLASNKERKSDTIARMVIDLKNSVVWCWLQRESAIGWIKYPLRFL